MTTYTPPCDCAGTEPGYPQHQQGCATTIPPRRPEPAADFPPSDWDHVVFPPSGLSKKEPF